MLKRKNRTKLNLRLPATQVTGTGGGDPPTCSSSYSFASSKKLRIDPPIRTMPSRKLNRTFIVGVGLTAFTKPRGLIDCKHTHSQYVRFILNALFLQTLSLRWKPRPRFGCVVGRSRRLRSFVAFWQALLDAGVNYDDIEQAYVGYCYGVSGGCSYFEEGGSANYADAAGLP